MSQPQVSRFALQWSWRDNIHWERGKPHVSAPGGGGTAAAVGRGRGLTLMVMARGKAAAPGNSIMPPWVLRHP